MRLIYSNKGAWLPQVLGHYRNPLFFNKAEKAAALVVMEEEYPEVRAAYQALGIKVVLLSEADGLGETVPLSEYLALQSRVAGLETLLEECRSKNGALPEKMTVKQLQDRLTALGVAFKQSANKAELLALLQNAEAAVPPPESERPPETEQPPASAGQPDSDLPPEDDDNS